MTNDGGPAFPRAGGGYVGCEKQAGMSLRDYFAAHAPVTDRLDPETEHALYMNGSARIRAKILAEAAYLWADAMLKAREEPR